VVGLCQRGAKPGHDGVTEEFIHRPFIGQNWFRPGRQVTVEHGDKFLWGIYLAETGKTPDVGKRGGDIPLLATYLQAVGINLVKNCGRDHSLQQAVLGFQFFSLGHIVENDGDALGGLIGIFEWREVEPPIQGAALWHAVRYLQPHHRLVSLPHRCKLSAEVPGRSG